MRNRVPSSSGSQWCGFAAGALSLFLAMGLCVPRPAQAEPTTQPKTSAPSPPVERPRVILLVRTSGDDGVMARLRAELSRGSWRILELRLDERAGPSPLGRVAAAENVRAAVRFEASTARVELWTSGAAGEVEEVLTSDEAGADELVLSYRITETLRARGLRFDDAAAPSSVAAAAAPTDSAKRPPAAPATGAAANQSPTPTDSPVPAGVPDAQRGLWVDAGVGLEPGLGALSATATAWLGARLELLPGWSAGAFASVPLAPQRLSASEGTAEISTVMTGVAADFAWLRSRQFRVRSGLGVAGAWSSMHGYATATNYVRADETVSAVVPFAETRAELSLHPRLWLWLGALAGFAFPEIVVQFAGEKRAESGRPALAFVLGLDVLALPLR